MWRRSALDLATVRRLALSLALILPPAPRFKLRFEALERLFLLLVCRNGPGRWLCDGMVGETEKQKFEWSLSEGNITHCELT